MKLYVVCFYACYLGQLIPRLASIFIRLIMFIKSGLNVLRNFIDYYVIFSLNDFTRILRIYFCILFRLRVQ